MTSPVLRPFAAALLAAGFAGALALAGCDAAAPSASADGATADAAADAAADADVVPGRYLVVLDATPAALAGGRLAPGAEAALDAVAATPGVVRRLTFTAALVGFSAEMTPEAVAALRSDPRVASVEPVRVGRGEETVTQPTTQATWGIDRVDQRALPLRGTYVYDRTGAGVTVYVIDSGLRTTHEEFGGRARLALHADGSAVDFVNDGLNGADCNGHGTQVASLAGGTTYGSAKDVQLVSVRVLRCDNTTTTDLMIAGMDWVAANATERPAVVNMSLSSGNSTAVEAAARNLIAAGITVVAAAGNGGGNACIRTPARVPEVLTVGATADTDARWTGSNIGSCLDLFAPGHLVDGAGHDSDTATRTGRSGTSYATPLTAGAVALYLESNPGATPAQVHQAIVGLATTGVVTSAGKGSPNRLLFTDAPQPPAPPVASFTASCARLVCTFTNTSTGADAYAWAFGDGNTSTATSPVHTYASAGTYTVTLTATGVGGSATATATVRPKR